MELRNRYIFVVLITLFAIGCKYEPDDIYIQNISPPPDVHQFDLGLTPESDTIKIFKTTKFKCNFNTFGLPIHKGIYSIGNSKWEVLHSQDTFSINPTKLTAGIFDLTLDLFTNTGTGSIGDIVGNEVYIAHKKWIVIIDGRPAPELDPQLERSEDGYLKIAWPKCGQYNFSHYELVFSHFFTNAQTKIIKNPDECFYIDTLFAGGSMNISLKTFVFTNNYPSSAGGWYEVSLPNLFIEELSIDSLRIFWTKSRYNCNYTISYNYITNILYETNTDTSVVIENPGFAERTDYFLYISSKHSSVYGRTLQAEVKRYVLGQKLSNVWVDFGYCNAQKTLYYSKYGDINAFDIITMNQLSSYSLSSNPILPMNSCQLNSTKVCIALNNSLNVFDDNSFANPNAIPYGNAGNGIDHVCFTDNNYLGVAARDRYDLVNVETRTIVASIPISDYPYYSKWACFSTSRDGKHATYCTRNGIWVYDIFEGSINLVYSDTRTYRSVLFDINNPEHLLLTLFESNIMEIRNVSDFSLVQQFVYPTQSQVLCNIDPETGNLLTTDFVDIFVYKPYNSLPIFKVKSNDSRPKLFNNRLVAYSGYHLDVTQYLTK